MDRPGPGAIQNKLSTVKGLILVDQRGHLCSYHFEINVAE